MVNPFWSQMTIWCMRISCCITKVTNIHTGYEILFVFYATNFARTPPNITLYVHGLSFTEFSIRTYFLFSIRTYFKKAHFRYEGCSESNAPHFFFSETIYSECMKSTHSIPGCFVYTLFFNIISVYDYGLTPARFLFT
jgi:hypothetical protein